ncbi:MAG: trigger factor [Verrucomicrobia bacterium]|nr:trigger factor [Verrucomicrobiota bacterium]
MITYLDKLPECQARIRVELEPELVRSERRRIVAKLAGEARVPGFRPGKVPVEVIEKRYQKLIEEELRDQLVRLGCREGTAKEKITAIMVTGVEDVELRDDGSFAFSATFQTEPEVGLPEYRGIPVTVPRIEVTDHDVDHEMEHIRFSLAEMVEVSDRPVRTGDHMLVDIKTELDGTPVGDVVPEAKHLSWVQETWLPLQEDIVLPGFGSQLEGQGIGEIRSFDRPVPSDHPIEALRDKTLHFTVTLVGIKERHLPEWTDELAGQLLGEEGDLATLKDRIRDRIRIRQEEERRSDLTTQILEHLDSQTDFELPDRVVKEEVQRQVNQIVRRSHMQGASDDELAEQGANILRHAKTQAEVNVKTSFILQQIAEKEGLQATEGEILQYCAVQANKAGMSLKKFVNRLKKADLVGSVVDTIVRAKTLDLLRDNATVTESDRAPHTCDHPAHQNA